MPSRSIFRKTLARVSGYIYIYVYVFVYIYIFIETESERDIQIDKREKLEIKLER